MSRHSKIVLVSAAGLLLAAFPALAKAPQKARPKLGVMETAIIENTGSTNTQGYRITVTTSGMATYTMTGRAGAAPSEMTPQGVVPRAITTALFHDLDAAMPLTEIPTRHGMRSISFGTRTYITYKGQRTPDLTFGGDPRAAALKADIDAIRQALKVSNTPRHPAMEPVSPFPQKD